MKLPLTSGKELVKILSKKGFKTTRIKGSHAQLENNEGIKITVPLHDKEIGRGLLSKILRDAKIPKEEYLKLK